MRPQPQERSPTTGRFTACGTCGYVGILTGSELNRYQNEIERDVEKTIRHWRVRGVTTAMAWQALGNRRDHAGWEQVRRHMIKWMLIHWLLAEHGAVERLAA